MGIVEPAQSMKAFSPALCSCRITTSSFLRQRWYLDYAQDLSRCEDLIEADRLGTLRILR